MRIQSGNPNDRHPIKRQSSFGTPSTGDKVDFAGFPSTPVPASPFSSPKDNPFSKFGAADTDTFVSPDIRSYFAEMGQAMGKTKPGDTFSPSDLRKYERMLVHADEFLDDTIRFSERASSPTDVFNLQKQDLAQRIGFTRAIRNFLQGKEATTGPDPQFQVLAHLKGSTDIVKNFFTLDKPEREPLNPFSKSDTATNPGLEAV